MVAASLQRAVLSAGRRSDERAKPSSRSPENGGDLFPRGPKETPALFGQARKTWPATHLYVTRTEPDLDPRRVPFISDLRDFIENRFT